MISDTTNQFKDKTHWKHAQIPIVIGVSAHRNIDKRYYAEITNQVGNFLDEIKMLCSHSDIYMLTGLAQGGDLLCAKIAIKKGIKIIAALPFETFNDIPYVNNDDFDDNAIQEYDDLIKNEYVIKQFVVPDIEGVPPADNIKDLRKYLFRQQAIYVATHSHVLLALWDGFSLENSRLECGTHSAVHFATEQNYHRSGDVGFFSSIGGTAVGVFSPRETRNYGEFTDSDFKYRFLLSKKYLNNKDSQADCRFTREKDSNIIAMDMMPQSLKDLLVKTDTYNEDNIKYCKSLKSKQKCAKETDDYLVNEDIYKSCEDTQAIHDCCRIASILSSENKSKYLFGIKFLSIFGLLLILSWMFYDQIGYQWTTIVCALMLLALVFAYAAINISEATKLAIKIKLKARFDAHTKFIEYRTLSETLRVQYYMSTLGLIDNVFDLYSWGHKVEMNWVKMATTVLLIGCLEKEWQYTTEEIVLNKWIGTDKDANAQREKNKNGTGQLGYHNNNSEKQSKKIKVRNVVKWITLSCTFIIYVMLFSAEIFGLFDLDCVLFWIVNGRILLKGCLSVFAAITFVVSYNYNKLSLDQNVRDSVLMANLYRVALNRISETRAVYQDEIERIQAMKSLVKEMARNQLLENGTWVAYNRDNGNDVPI